MHDERLTRLEEKLAFQDDLLTSLNAIVAEQQQRLDFLQDTLRLLYRQIQQLQPDDGSPAPTHELPPHY